jgi:hypothetical protein
MTLCEGGPHVSCKVIKELMTSGLESHYRVHKIDNQGKPTKNDSTRVIVIRAFCPLFSGISACRDVCRVKTLYLYVQKVKIRLP